MTCKHTESRWEEVFQYEDWETGEPVFESELVERSTMKDIDLHRMQCTKCGAIEYYSGAAREHFTGVKNHDFIEESNQKYLKARNR